MNKTLNEYQTGGITGNGIFNALSTYHSWMDATLMDYEYYYNHSGDKIASNLVVAFGNDFSKITSIIENRFGKQWDRLHATLTMEYNPIENYNMSESTTIESSKEGTINDTSNTNTTTTGNLKTYGYNSDIATPTDSNDGTSVGQASATNISTGTETTTNTINRSGNIGVTTSQQLIQSERDLYLWDFYEQIYIDVDKVLTLPIYN